MEATFPLPPLPATRGATFDCGVHYKHKKLNPFATSPPGCFQGKGGGVLSGEGGGLEASRDGILFELVFGVGPNTCSSS